MRPFIQDWRGNFVLMVLYVFIHLMVLPPFYIHLPLLNVYCIVCIMFARTWGDGWIKYKIYNNSPYSFFLKRIISKDPFKDTINLIQKIFFVLFLNIILFNLNYCKAISRVNKKMLESKKNLIKRPTINIIVDHNSKYKYFKQRFSIHYSRLEIATRT